MKRLTMAIFAIMVLGCGDAELDDPVAEADRLNHERESLGSTSPHVCTANGGTPAGYWHVESGRVVWLYVKCDDESSADALEECYRYVCESRGW
jgi:hypothetical protein